MKVVSAIVAVLFGSVVAQSGPSSSTAVVSSTTTSPYAVCANPLFDNYELVVDDDFGPTCSIDVRHVVPAVFPSNGTVCTAFAGQQSCCTAGHLLEITRAANFQAQQIAHARAYLNEQIAADQAANAANAAMNVTNSDFVQDCTFLGYSATTCATLATQVQDFQTTKHQFEADSLTCLAALEDYTTGMLCFACSTEWAQYVHSGNSSVNIHNHTCTSVAAACSPVNTDFVKLFTQYANILQTIYTANNAIVQQGFSSFHHRGDDNGVNPISQWVLSYPDLCGGNITNPGTCNYYICAHWIGGLGCRFPEANLPSSGGFRRMLASGDMNSVISELKPSVGSLIASARKLDATTATYTNFYQTNGYDATCVGSNMANCASSSAAPAAALSGGAIAGIVAGVLAFVGVAGAAVFVVRRRMAPTLVAKV